jgi:hypothetical protein
MQPLPQYVSYAGHSHDPLMQVPEPQLFPHAPQLAESVVSLTHLPPQSTSGNGQTHAPALQTELPPQTLPQAPQLLLSYCVLRHVLPHSV